MYCGIIEEEEEEEGEVWCTPTAVEEEKSACMTFLILRLAVSMHLSNPFKSIPSVPNGSKMN